MAMKLHLLLFSFLLVSLTSTTAQQPNPTTNRDTSQRRDYNYVEAIIGSNDFSNWAETLAAEDPSTFPISATLFLPMSESFSMDPANPTSPDAFDPYVFAYHVVMQRLTFLSLQGYPVGTHLPTLLPNATVVVTNNSAGNFSINHIKVSHPNFYINGAVVIHGIESMLRINWNQDLTKPLSVVGTAVPISTPKTTGTGNGAFIPVGAGVSPGGSGNTRSGETRLGTSNGLSVLLSVLVAVLGVTTWLNEGSVKRKFKKERINTNRSLKGRKSSKRSSQNGNTSIVV